MTQEYDRSVQDLLDWNICERNSDGELKPTADFLVWYYGYLIHEVTDSYGEDWEFTVDVDNITEEQEKEMEEGEKEREELVRDCIKNQIVIWTAQKIGNKTYVEHRHRVDEHTEVVYNLIKEIDDRLMETHQRKMGQRKK
jgi:hypothetical protein